MTYRDYLYARQINLLPFEPTRKAAGHVVLRSWALPVLVMRDGELVRKDG